MPAYIRTILELTAKNDSPMYLAMKLKKQKHGKTVERVRELKRSQAANENLVEPNSTSDRKKFVRDENYIPHQASDQHTETGMSVNLLAGAASAELELAADSGEAARRQQSTYRWDRKRKRMAHVDTDGGRKMIRSESGAKIPASFRSGRYEEWRKRNASAENDDDDAPAASQRNQKKPVSEFRPHWVKHNESMAKKNATKASGELRDKQQIVKERVRKDNIKQRLKRKTKNSKKGKKRHSK